MLTVYRDIPVATQGTPDCAVMGCKPLRFTRQWFEYEHLEAHLKPVSRLQGEHS